MAASADSRYTASCFHMSIFEALWEQSCGAGVVVVVVVGGVSVVRGNEKTVFLCHACVCEPAVPLLTYFHEAASNTSQLIVHLAFCFFIFTLLYKSTRRCNSIKLGLDMITGLISPRTPPHVLPLLSSSHPAQGREQTSGVSLCSCKTVSGSVGRQF